MSRFSQGKGARAARARVTISGRSTRHATARPIEILLFLFHEMPKRCILVGFTEEETHEQGRAHRQDREGRKDFESTGQQRTKLGSRLGHVIPEEGRQRDSGWFWHVLGPIAKGANRTESADRCAFDDSCQEGREVRRGRQTQKSGEPGPLNCRVAVSLSIATATSSLPVAWRLYLPEIWPKDRPRRKKVGIPSEIGFETKVQIALKQIEKAVEDGIPDAPVHGELLFMQPSAFGINRDNVSASDTI